MDALIKSPALGITITLVCFMLARWFQYKSRFKSLPPVITATVLIIVILNILGLDYERYNNGGKYISFLLGPATIALALPLARNIQILKDNLKPLLLGVVVGSVTGIISVLILGKVFGVSQELVLSLVAKSVTTPIAMGITENIGGIPALTAVFVIFTGMFGAFAGHKILYWCGVKNDVAIGIAIGAAAHGLGTNRCLDESELQAAVAGVGIALVGIVTALFAPFCVKIFSL